MYLRRTYTYRVETISWEDFEQVALHVGTVLRCEVNANARKPSYCLWVDFGPLGVRTSSAQITVHYTLEELVGRQVLAVLNFPPKRIAGFESQCLVTGFADENGNVILAAPDKPTPNGARLF